VGRKNHHNLKGKSCIFCGGESKSTTVEHMPPRVMFRGKQRPKGHEFPSCERCNSGFSQLDQIAAMFAFSTSASFYGGGNNSEFIKAAMGVANNIPELYGLIDLDSATSDGLPTEAAEHGVEAITVSRNLFRKYLNPWAAKLVCAIWYEQTKKVIDDTKRIYVHSIPSKFDLNTDLHKLIQNHFSGLHVAAQGKKDFGDQFFYRFAIGEGQRFGMFFAVFHDAIGVMGAVGEVEDFIRNDQYPFGEIFRTCARMGLIHDLPI
jgi:hypothetical protein